MTLHPRIRPFRAVAALLALLVPLAPAALAATPPPYRAYQKIVPNLEVGGTKLTIAALPASLELWPDLGLITARPMTARRIHRSVSNLFETRATITPNGDYLLMFPDGGHYSGKREKVNDLVAYRSRDRGRTWEGPTVAIDTDYNHHGFIPLIPKGSKRLYSFGTQAVWSHFKPINKAQAEDSPIGFLWSDDDGRTWSGPTLIAPQNDPGFRGMSVVRMTETPKGTWLLGSHAADWSTKPLVTRQYILRSTDQGKTWTVLPKAQPGGWQCPGFGRMDETTIMSLGGDEVFALSRTPEGHLWSLRSLDDGQTWSDPAPTPLVHPDAPAMLFKLGDGRTIAVLHHNRSSVAHLGMKERADLSSDHPAQKDRNELWISLSQDGGRTWSEPRFLLANALQPFEANAWFNYQVSYADMFSDQGVLHLFIPHRWRQVIYFTLPESELAKLPTAADLRRQAGG